MIFTIKMHWKLILLQECIGTDLYYKNALEFYDKNSLGVILL